MTIDFVDTLVPQGVSPSSRGEWISPEEFGLITSPRQWGPIPRQRRRTAVWTVPPIRPIVPLIRPTVGYPEPPVTQHEVEVVPAVLAAVAAEPAATAARVLPMRQIAQRLRPSEWSRPVKVSLAALLMSVVTATPTFGGDEAKSVSVTIDGQTRTITTVEDQVGPALAGVNIELGARDVIAPALDAPVREGSVINVLRGKKLTLDIDGQQRTVWTTQGTVAGALKELGIDASRYQWTADRSRELTPNGLALSARTLQPVTLTVGTAAAKKLTTAVATVGDLLAAQGVSLAKTDRVQPSQDTPIAAGQDIVVTRVSVRTEQVLEKIPQPKAVTTEDAQLGRGNQKVTEGHAGQRRLTIEKTTVNGKTTSKQVGNTVVTKAEPTVTSVGTKETGRPESWSLPWDQMAFCESTNRWDANTGNGTYGGIQFMTPTWLQYGGGEFAPRADLATKEQQIIVGERLYAAEGLAPWHCARLLGWGFGQYQG